MGEIKPSRLGRPPGSTRVPHDVLAGVWVQVLITRIKARTRDGKTPSVRAACQEIADNVGIISVVGGNLDDLVKENAKRKKSWQRFQSDGSGFGPNAAGANFVNHTISNPGTLHARYSQAKKLAADRRVRFAWMNLARQMLGLPSKRQVQPFMGRSRAGLV